VHHVDRALGRGEIVGDGDHLVGGEVRGATHPYAKGPVRQPPGQPGEFVVSPQNGSGVAEQDEHVELIADHFDRHRLGVRSSDVGGHRCTGVDQ
jgi:hypothetical protein